MKTWLLVVSMVAVAVGVAWLERSPVPTWVIGLGMVSGWVVDSILGLMLAVRYVPYNQLEVPHDFLSSLCQVIGTIYAVLISFSIIISWQVFTATQTIVAQEANAVADIDRMARGLPVPIYRQIHEAARTYTHLVIAHEWPAMASGQESPLAYAALVDLWHIYSDFQPSLRSDPLYQQSLSRMNDLSGARRVRLLAIHSRVPTVMWILLYGGGVIVVLTSYLFRVRRFWLQALVIGLVSGMIAFCLFLTAAMEGPFQGDVCVSPDAFSFVLDHLQ